MIRAGKTGHGYRLISMKRFIPAIALIFGCAPACWAAASAPLTTLRAVAALTNDQASRRQPVAFEATVTYYVRTLKNLDVQDGDIGIYVKTTNDAVLVPGDRVLVQGTDAAQLPALRARQ